MRSLLKVLFFSGVIFLAIFLPLLFSQAQAGLGGDELRSYANDFESNDQEQTGESRDLITERRFEQDRIPRVREIPVHNSNGGPLSPQEQNAMQGSIKNDFGVNDDTVGISDHYSPAIAKSIAPTGDFVITWEDYRNGNSDIYAQRFDSSGTPQGSNFKVNDDAGTAGQDIPAIAMNGSGNFVITWEDGRNGNSDIYAQRFDSSGTPQGANFMVNNDDGTANQARPAIAMDGSGNFVITWRDGRNGSDIYAQRYDSSGTPQGANFKVNDDAGTADQFDPAIAMDGSGNFVITWQDYRTVNNGNIYAQRYDSSGTPQGANFKVNDDAGTANQWYPAIAMDDSGNFVITWSDERSNYDYDIYAQRYDSSGTPQGANFKVNDDAGAVHQFDPAIAMDGSGNFVITWQDLRNGNSDIYAQRFDSTGAPQGANFKVNDDAGTASQAAIAMDGSAYFTITWRDGRNGNTDIYAQRYNSSGTPQGPNFRVNDDAVNARQYFPAMAMDDSGNFVITWGDLRNGNSDIYAQRFDPSGTPQGPNFKANDDAGNANQYDPAMAMDDSGNFVITWGDLRNGNYSDIYAQRFDSSGTPQGINLKVNDDAGSADQYNPAIAMDGSGNFVITWTDSRNGNDNLDIYAQRYNSSGIPLGSNFKVNDDAGITGQWSSAITMDNSGNFAITWTDYRNGDLNPDVYAQRYNSSGIPLGSNFKVNDDAGTADQYDPAIAVDLPGNFVITWADLRNGNSDIYAQRFNSSGTPQGANFMVNDDAGTTDQHDPAIAMDSSGNFVIAWDDVRNGNLDIYAQGYNSSGTATGSNYLVPNLNYSTFEQAYPAVGANSSNICFAWEDDRGDPWKDIYAKIVDWDWSNYICGDVSRDGVVNSADISYLVNYFFIAGPAPMPPEAGDVNNDGLLNSADISYLINYLFVAGPAPCP
jgi:hypothetical protein